MVKVESDTESINLSHTIVIGKSYFTNSLKPSDAYMRQ